MRANRNIRFNLIGGGTLYLPPREVKGFYKDFITGHNVVEVNDDRFEVRNSQEEIQNPVDTLNKVVYMTKPGDTFPTTYGVKKLYDLSKTEEQKAFEKKYELDIKVAERLARTDTEKGGFFGGLASWSPVPVVTDVVGKSSDGELITEKTG